MTDKTTRAVTEDAQTVSKKLVNMGDNTFAERVESYDPGKTGFFAGREFRSFLEFSIPAGQSLVIKAVSLVDVVLYGFAVELTLAQVRVTLKGGGTEGGTFDTALPILKANQMSVTPAYQSQVTMTAGGTHTGGTAFDIVNVVSGSNANKAIAQTATEDQPIGFPAGSYYMTIANTGSATAAGIIKFRWEERP